MGASLGVFATNSGGANLDKERMMESAMTVASHLNQIGFSGTKAGERGKKRLCSSTNLMETMKKLFVVVCCRSVYICILNL